MTFASGATTLVDGDTNADNNIFLHDRLDGSVTRISTGPAGEQANDRSSAAVISTDGGAVAFRSQASNLVSGDTNGTAWDTFRGQPCRPDATASVAWTASPSS